MSIFRNIAPNLVVSSFKRTGKLLTRGEKKRSVWIAFFSLLSALIDVAGLSLVIPVMMVANDPTLLESPGPIHDVRMLMGIQNPQSFMMALACILLLVFVFKNGFSLFTNYLQSRFAYDIATNLARRQFMKYYNLGYTYFKDTNSADIANNVLNIPTFFVSGVLVSLINFLTEASVLILIVIGIAVADFALFCALLLVLVPCGFLIYGGTKNRLYAIGQKQLKLGVITLQRINQAIFGYVDVRLTNKETYFMNAYIKDQVELNETYKVKHVLNMIPTKALEVIGMLGILVIFVYAGYFDGDGSIFKYVATFAVAASRVLPSLNRCLTAVMSIKSNLFALEVLEDRHLPVEMTRMTISPFAYNDTIEFRDLSFKFKGAEAAALDHFNLTVKKGERIGIIGESGSGKTTLMNLLLRFLREDGGGIYVDGHKLEEEDIASWRAKVGYVQQHVFLIDDTLRQNVAFGEHRDEIDETRLMNALHQASLGDFVKSLPAGLDTMVGEMGARLSGGQRQRIGIARALYYQSSVLVFDEATSALDSETENSITESFQSLNAETTVFVVAHRFTTLRHCDRIVELKDGKVLNIWTYPELVHEKMLK